MSKVAIAGNASGTGTFTIAAPNSNTDRTLTLPDEAGTIITTAGVPASALPAGSVLQVVQATNSTGVNTTGTSYIDANLSATITPLFSSSKILVFAQQAIQAYNSAGAYGTGLWRLLRDSTAILSPANTSNGNIFHYDYGNSGINIFKPTVIYLLDSPSTTSAITYKTQIAKGTNGGVLVAANAENNLGVMILMEIAA